MFDPERPREIEVSKLGPDDEFIITQSQTSSRVEGEQPDRDERQERWQEQNPPKGWKPKK